ncbi:MAG: hypothetical protein V1850_07485 [Candidatus Bathyarchaeota archaeon]
MIEMFGLFHKKCAYCGVQLKGSGSIERMGKKFCSDEHADAYWANNKIAAGNAEGNDEEDENNCGCG